MQDLKDTIQKCIRSMLRPVVKFAFRHSIGIREIIELLKVTVVEIAAEDFRKRGEKVNSSRLCVATGLHRGEVLRIWKGEKREANTAYTVRVIGQWQGDKRFCSSSGKPRILKHDGEKSEFNELVRTVCTNVHPGTVLFDLERIGAVEHTPRGVKLVLGAYTPKGDPEAGFKMYAEDCSHLQACIEESVFHEVKPPNLHIRTEYDNVSEEDLPQIRHWFYKHGNLFHKKARDFLSKYDIDLNPKKGKKGGKKIFLASFSRVVEE